MVVHCNACGYEGQDSERVRCPKCGIDLAAGPAADPTPPANATAFDVNGEGDEAEDAPAPTSAGAWGTALWAIGCAQVVLGLLGGIAMGEPGLGIGIALGSLPVFALGSGLRGVQWLIDRER